MRDNGNRVIAVAADVDSELVFVTPDSIGLRRIEFALNGPVEQTRAETIGRSVLTFGPGSEAVWAFRASEPKGALRGQPEK